MKTDIPLSATLAAKQLRGIRRRTRSGVRPMPWEDIAAELERRGLGRFDPSDLAMAVARLPADVDELAGPSGDEMASMVDSWIDGWAEEFPGEPWPGLDEARERIRAKYFQRKATR